jgi:hypothetical protein
MEVDPPSAGTAPTDPISSLERQLAVAVEQLKSAGNVHQNVIVDAQTLAATLLERFRTTIVTAQNVAKEDAGATLRKNGKQPVQPQCVSQPADFRLNGKQPPKRKITDFSGMPRKGRATPQCL